MRRWRTTGSVVLACAAVAAGMIGVSALVGGDDTGRPTGAGEGASSPDDGWRWESYQTIELQVPEDWGYGVTGSPPCLVEEKQRPYVGRPGLVQTIGCWGPPPLAHRASYVWFDTKSRNPAVAARHAELGIGKLGLQPADHGWVEETRLVDGLRVTVLSDDDTLRRRILDSARVIDGSDANGCTPDHRLAHQPDGRPASTGGLASIGTVESIAVCRYAVRQVTDRSAPLIASSVFTGDAAGALVDAITSAPEGSGPNKKECSDTYGADILVLTVRGGGRGQEVLIRYDGCDFNGTDDGQTLRQLTAPVLRPILTGIHQPQHYIRPVYELVVGPLPSEYPYR